MQNQIYRYYIFTFLKDMAFFSAVLVPFFTDWGGIPQFQVQLLQSWFMLWFFLLEVPTGAVADFLGRKISLGLGALVVAIAALVYGSIPSFVIFLIGEFLFALAMSLISGADQAWLYDTLKSQGKEKDSQKFFGRAESMHLAALLISASFGGLLANRFGLNAPMLFSAIPFVLASLVGFSLKEPKMHSGPKESQRYALVIKEGLQYFYHHPVLLKMAIDTTIVATSAYFMIWLYQPLLTKLGAPVAIFGLVHSALVLIEILISNKFSWLEKIFYRWSYEKVSAILVGAGFIVAALFPAWWSFILLLIFSGGFGLTRVTFMTVKMNPLIESDRRATVLSAISMIRRLALVIFNPVVGVLIDFSLPIALLAVGILPLASLFFNYRNSQKEDELAISQISDK